MTTDPVTVITATLRRRGEPEPDLAALDIIAALNGNGYEITSKPATGYCPIHKSSKMPCRMWHEEAN